ARPAPPGPPAPPSEPTPPAAAGIGRATGQVVPPGPDPAFRNAGPPYPEGARLRGETGSVGLELAVGADGRVLNVAIARSSGSPALDEAARRAAQAWRFRPATLDGRPVPGTVRTSVHFRLS
ncbi:energy transducer TonB, partial [Roseococcus sp. DSY-14]|uniref:energy transducer TonB n=1 Tax=Roseococcus sp. DSY-14 TaxID=3369650 RepID=UPI00387B1CB6